MGRFHLFDCEVVSVLKILAQLVRSASLGGSLVKAEQGRVEVAWSSHVEGIHVVCGVHSRVDSVVVEDDRLVEELLLLLERLW